MKSFRHKDAQDEPPTPGRNGERNFRKEKHSNETHASTTDPDARLTQASGAAGPAAALEMLAALPSGHKTVGADKNYDTAQFVAAARELRVTPHIAQNINTHRDSNIDGRTTPFRLPAQPSHPKADRGGQRLDQDRGGLAQTKLRGVGRVGWTFTFHAAAYNLARLPALLATG